MDAVASAPQHPRRRHQWASLKREPVIREALQALTGTEVASPQLRERILELRERYAEANRASGMGPDGQRALQQLHAVQDVVSALLPDQRRGTRMFIASYMSKTPAQGCRRMSCSDAPAGQYATRERAAALADGRRHLHDAMPRRAIGGRCTHQPKGRMPGRSPNA